MKKQLFISLLLIPIISFAQLPKKEKILIDEYANSLCECVNEVMNTLDVNMIKYLDVFAKNGEVAANNFLTAFMEKGTPEEVQALLDSSNLMQAEDFGLKIEACEDNSKLSSKAINEIEGLKGGAYDYFMNSLSNKSNCKLSKMLLDMGANNN